MTLDEAISAKQLMILEPFVGFKPCGRLTGKYYFASALEQKQSIVKVEVKDGLFGKKFVDLSLIREVKEVKIVRFLP